MPTRLEFIPYGDGWTPTLRRLPPGESITGQRRPKPESTTKEMGASAVEISCDSSDLFTTYEFTNGDGVIETGVIRSGDKPAVVHRYAPGPLIPKNGTLRITHTESLESDPEVIEISGPHPMLSGGKLAH